MLVAVGVVASAAAGCGGEKTIDDEAVERYVREDSQAPGLIEAVDCPSGVEVEDGATFECEVHTKGDGLEVVTLRQVEGGQPEQVRVRQVRLPRGQRVRIIPENVEGLIRGRAAEPERIVSIDCPAGVEVEKGARFECVVRFDDGSEDRVTIVQRDALGNVEIARGAKPR